MQTQRQFIKGMAANLDIYIDWPLPDNNEITLEIKTTALRVEDVSEWSASETITRVSTRDFSPNDATVEGVKEIQVDASAIPNVIVGEPRWIVDRYGRAQFVRVEGKRANGATSAVLFDTELKYPHDSESVVYLMRFRKPLSSSQTATAARDLRALATWTINDGDDYQHQVQFFDIVTNAFSIDITEQHVRTVAPWMLRVRGEGWRDHVRDALWDVEQQLVCDSMYPDLPFDPNRFARCVVTTAGLLSLDKQNELDSAKVTRWIERVNVEWQRLTDLFAWDKVRKDETGEDDELDAEDYDSESDCGGTIY